MQISQGPHLLGDTLTIYIPTHRFDTGNTTDGDAPPTWRLYEEETGTPILTGTVAKLDDANTAGFYSEQIALTAANGFEENKCYGIRLEGTVNSVTGSDSVSFKIAPFYLFGIVTRGTAQGGSAGTIQLAASEAYGDDALNGAAVYIYEGTGAGQRGIITDYVGATDTASVTPDWPVPPDGTSKYVVYATPASEGVAQTGDVFSRVGAPAGATVSADIAAIKGIVDAINAITTSLPDGGSLSSLLNRLSTLATKTAVVVADGANSATSFKTDLTGVDNNHYKDCLWKFTSGDLENQVKKITASDGTTGILTFANGFTATPANGVSGEIVNE